MDILQFKQAMSIANCYSGENITAEDVKSFCGYGRLSFKPVKVTIYDVAKLIRFICWKVDGDVSKKSINRLKQERIRKKFIIVDT